MTDRRDQIELRTGSVARVSGALVVVAAVDQPRVRLEVAEPGSPARLDWLSDGDVLTIGADQWRLGAVRNPAPTSGGAQGSDAGQLVAVLTREPARP